MVSLTRAVLESKFKGFSEKYFIKMKPPKFQFLGIQVGIWGIHIILSFKINGLSGLS